MNEKTHANSKTGRLKPSPAPEPRVGMLSAETAGSAEDSENLVLMLDQAAGQFPETRR